MKAADIPKDCVVLHLFHGRRHPSEDLQDWGEEGPYLVLSYFQVTYSSSFRFGWPIDEIYDDEFDIYDDMVYYDGFYYGDYSIASPEEYVYKATNDKSKEGYQNIEFEFPSQDKLHMKGPDDDTSIKTCEDVDPT